MTSGNGRKILVLEDDPAVGLMLRFLLEEDGFKVELVERGRDFIPLVLATRPDLICLDARLPDADGFDIFEELKADPRTAGIPVIFVTVRESEKERGLKMGAKAYLVKPFQEKELRLAVQAALP